VTVDEVDVAADSFFEKLQYVVLRMLPRHGRHGVMEVMCKIEDHGWLRGYS